MTANGWLQILVFFALVLLVTKPLGVGLFGLMAAYAAGCERV